MENATDIAKVDVKLVGPEGCGSQISVGGVEYKADKGGVFSVPAKAATDLAAHGFKPAPTVASKPAATGA